MTLQSEQIAELAQALSNAQGVIEPPKKTRTAEVKGEKNGKVYRYTYAYADLSDLIAALKKPFNEFGLSFSQTTRCENSGVVLRTTLMHASGQWMASEYPMPTYQRPQDFGSALSYHKRYQLSSVVGVSSEEDDDGARAQDAHPEQPRSEQAPVEEDEPPKGRWPEPKDPPKDFSRQKQVESLISDTANLIGWVESAVCAAASAYFPQGHERGHRDTQPTYEERWGDAHDEILEGCTYYETVKGVMKDPHAKTLLSRMQDHLMERIAAAEKAIEEKGKAEDVEQALGEQPLFEPTGDAA